jgi:exopolyphosphatase/guanosine-5'-triphosphate,3'-diphosphate pyrophosphatase
MGGTIRNLARAAQKLHGYPVDIMHGYFLQRADLERITNLLLERPARKRAAVPGISGDRADIVLAGALVYRQVLRAGEREGLWISGNGVREGAFFRRFLPAPHIVPDVRKFSVENLAHQYQQPPAHLSHVRRLARRLFEELESIHGLGRQEAELLDAAATLHDVGMTVGYHLHHKHGAYLVLAARLNGFDHREQALLSRLVRYHRKGRPKLGELAELTLEGDQKLLETLTLCLRLAEMMERSRAGRVRDLRATIGSEVVRLDVLATEEPAVELWEANKQIPLFQRALDRRLELQWVESDG